MNRFDFSDFVVVSRPAEQPKEQSSVVNPSSDNGRSFLRDRREEAEELRSSH
jgi:hypothetical protein